MVPQWELTERLKDINVGDDLCLLTQKFTDKRQIGTQRRGKANWTEN